MTVFITGAAGFIGSYLAEAYLRSGNEPVIALDRFSYAASQQNRALLEAYPQCIFVEGSVGNAQLVAELLARHQPRAIFHLAAQTHVDRSLSDPLPFVQDNYIATTQLLEATLRYWQTMRQPELFRFIHISTDEVYGETVEAVNENAPYRPNNPYAASKAATDHMVRAYGHSYGLPSIITMSTNNYGPRQHPEKFIPRLIECALHGQPLPLYGDGKQQRDWLYVADHVRALQLILAHGNPGETYHISSQHHARNIDVAEAICALLDELHPCTDGALYRTLIAHVADRPGHDRSYALDSSKLRALGWRPFIAWEEGLRETVAFYTKEKSA